MRVRLTPKTGGTQLLLVFSFIINRLLKLILFQASGNLLSFSRPQILALAKLKEDFKPRSTHLLSFLSQLKAGEYMFLYVSACVC